MAFEAATITVIVLALSAGLYLLTVNYYRRSRKKKLKPPQPPLWPIIGHLHLLIKKRPIHRILSSLSEKYGGIMHLQLGFRPVLVIASSDLAKECFTTNDIAFASRPALSGGKHLGYDYKVFSLAPYGSYWRNLLSKAQQEIDTHIGRDRLIEETDLYRLKYLEAIVKETLRLYPAAPLLLPHEAIKPCTVGGFHVPAGTRLLVNVWAIHRDPAVWDRPTEFDPERFLKGGKEIDVKGQNFELIPFGSGRRMCPGMPLALTVVKYTLGRLLQSFEWSVPAGTKIDMSEGLGLTMPKAVPLEAIIKPRLPLHLF